MPDYLNRVSDFVDTVNYQADQTLPSTHKYCYA